MRDAVSRPYAAAVSRPTDVDAVGALARTLHAWDQWSAAHDAYLRAQALAPRAVEWLYLDGLALQRLSRPTEAAARFDAVDMRLCAAAARRRQGELIGGETGQKEISHEDDWMASQRIRDPERMAAMILPQFRSE